MNQVVYTDTNWAIPNPITSGNVTSLVYATDTARAIAGANVILTDPRTGHVVNIQKNSRIVPYLSSDGVVPVWSSGDVNQTLDRSVPEVIGPRLVNSHEVVVPDNDHGVVASSPLTSSAIIADATTPGGVLNWRLK